MHPWISKLVTRPAWWLERSLTHGPAPRPRLQPLQVGGSAITLVIQTTPRTFRQSLWSAYSLITYLPPVRLMIALDALHWRPHDLQELERLLPGAIATTTYQLMAQLRAPAPRLRQWAQHHPLARKLTTLLATQASGPILYADDDVMAFAPLGELEQWCAAPQQPLLLAEEHTNIDPLLHTAAQARGWQAAPRFNSGLIALPQGFLDPRLCEELLTHIPLEQLGWFAETTLLAYQLSSAPTLPAERYIVNCQRQFVGQVDVDYTQIALRHFVGPVRHLLRLRGIPAFLSSCSYKPS